MSEDVHVRFCEHLGVRFPRVTHRNIYLQSRLAGERVMKSITQFLERKLRLRVNAAKSVVDRPWKLKFLGYSMTMEKKPRMKLARQSIERFKAKLRALFRQGKGRSVQKLIEELNPILRGWINYFRLAEVKDIFEELDGWIRRKLRNILWRQWKRVYTRARNLMKRGLAEVRAWQSATNGRGAWWNSGASHMNEAFPKSYFDRIGLISLLTTILILHKTP